VSLREISRRLGILETPSGAIYAPKPSSQPTLTGVPPTFLDKYAFKLSVWLKTEATKSRKQRRSLRQMHLDLRALGFDGAHDRVAAFARQSKVDQLERSNSASKSTDKSPADYMSGSRHQVINHLCSAHRITDEKKPLKIN
jgi:hypothetical protein